MPTREEKAAAIEAALRQRFFQFVPRVVAPQRATWTDVQHDTDRLSRALAAYAIVSICDLDDATAAGSVTDGSDDGGIDALWFDRSKTRLVLIQSKFKRGGTSPSQAEILKTINGIEALIERRFDEFNERFRQRLDEIEEALDTPGIAIEAAVIYLGENLSPHVSHDLNALQARLNAPTEILSWRSCGADEVFAWLIGEQTPVVVTADLVLENWAYTETPRKAVYGQISAASVAELVATYGKSLFERNIRHYLGSVGVNTAIEESVRRRGGDFFYLNNGLTAVAEEITRAAGTSVRCVFRAANLSVVNGAQTAGAIANAALAGNIPPEAKMLITIIQIGANQDDIGLRVTRARNHQTAVRGVDFAALDPNQERLRQELAVAGITYHYRPSAEARARRDDAFTLEEAAVALACLSFPVLHSRQVLQIPVADRRNAVDFVVAAKKEIGRLWEQDGAFYNKMFSATLSGTRTCRLVRVYRFIDTILAGSERSETAYFRRMFFRHGRYFVMAFVGHRSPEILNSPDLALSPDDETSLSRRTNELAELIYAHSRPLQTIKGYLSVFRNLTDSQPLADGVLDRLAQPAAPAVAVLGGGN